MESHAGYHLAWEAQHSAKMLALVKHKTKGIKMDSNDRTNRLFDKAKRVGMTDAMTGDGRPSRSMVAEAISDAEFDAGQCGEAFIRKLDERMNYHREGKSGNPADLDCAVVLALLNVRSAYQEAFSSVNK